MNYFMIFGNFYYNKIFIRIFFLTKRNRKLDTCLTLGHVNHAWRDTMWSNKVHMVVVTHHQTHLIHQRSPTFWTWLHAREEKEKKKKIISLEKKKEKCDDPPTSARLHMAPGGVTPVFFVFFSLIFFSFFSCAEAKCVCLFLEPIKN